MTSGLTVLAEGAGRYVHWGVIQISLTNLTIIAVMVLLFILALVVPFPSHDESADEESGRR
jgi:hypothetical protein